MRVVVLTLLVACVCVRSQQAEDEGVMSVFLSGFLESMDMEVSEQVMSCLISSIEMSTMVDFSKYSASCAIEVSAERTDSNTKLVSDAIGRAFSNCTDLADYPEAKLDWDKLSDKYRVGDMAQKAGVMWSLGRFDDAGFLVACVMLEANHVIRGDMCPPRRGSDVPLFALGHVDPFEFASFAIDVDTSTLPVLSPDQKVSLVEGYANGLKIQLSAPMYDCIQHHNIDFSGLAAVMERIKKQPCLENILYKDVVDGIYASARMIEDKLRSCGDDLVAERLQLHHIYVMEDGYEKDPDYISSRDWWLMSDLWKGQQFHDVGVGFSCAWGRDLLRVDRASAFGELPVVCRRFWAKVTY
eukprot:TRINITY_DN27519_c0_g1_i1.p1 TRINITY_DN27519_c0_g1~~TRINITY_DN27519_c0_g1_i1.p1  ORF type:complete len:355 (-),score=54.83 TRINITY_DN27519_c0_g1_i1:75-1139(-)